MARPTMSHGISSSDLNELLMLLFNFIQIVRKIELLIIENVGKCLCFTIKTITRSFNSKIAKESKNILYYIFSNTVTTCHHQTDIHQRTFKLFV